MIFNTNKIKRAKIGKIKNEELGIGNYFFTKVFGFWSFNRNKKPPRFLAAVFELKLLNPKKFNSQWPKALV